MFKTLFLLLLYATPIYAMDAPDFEKNIVIVPIGEHYIKDVELNNNTIIRGENKFLSILKLSPGAKKALFYATDKSNIEILNLTLINDTNDQVPLIYFEGNERQINNITIRNCILKITNAESDVIVFKKYVSNIRIENNIVQAKRNPKIRRDYTQISCIRLQGVDTYSKNNSYIFIKNNLLQYGNCGFRISGKGTPPNPLWFDGNVIQGQVGSGAFFYHGSRQKIVNNYFSDIIAVSMENCDGGVVWLDEDKNGNILFTGNTIENNHGNGIFIEELKNSIISHNQIRNNKERVSDKYEINNRGIQFSSKGGNGILITGGIVGLQITDNQIRNNENSGILISTDLGVQNNYSIPLLNIKSNIIAGNKNFGIEIDGKIRNLIIKNNIIVSEKERYYTLKKSLLVKKDTNITISDNIKLKTTKKIN